jgi:hypothetical protein
MRASLVPTVACLVLAAALCGLMAGAPAGASSVPSLVVSGVVSYAAPDGSTHPVRSSVVEIVAKGTSGAPKLEATAFYHSKRKL